MSQRYLHKLCLLEGKRYLSENLEVCEVLSPLIARQVLNDEEVAIINTGQGEEQKTQLLTDILINKPPMAYEAFLEVLQHKKPYVEDKLTEIQQVIIDERVNVEQCSKSVECQTEDITFRLFEDPRHDKTTGQNAAVACYPRSTVSSPSYYDKRMDHRVLFILPLKCSDNHETVFYNSKSNCQLCPKYQIYVKAVACELLDEEQSTFLGREQLTTAIAAGFLDTAEINSTSNKERKDNVIGTWIRFKGFPVASKYTLEFQLIDNSSQSSTVPKVVSSMILSFDVCSNKKRSHAVLKQQRASALTSSSDSETEMMVAVPKLLSKVKLAKSINKQSHQSLMELHQMIQMQKDNFEEFNRKTMELKRQYVDEPSTDMTVLINLQECLALYMQDRMDDAIDVAESALVACKGAVNASQLTAQCLTQLAGYYRIQKKFAATQDKSVESFQNLDALVEGEVHVETLLNDGRMFMDLMAGCPEHHKSYREQAIKRFDKGIAILNKMSCPPLNMPNAIHKLYTNKALTLLDYPKSEFSRARKVSKEDIAEAEDCLAFVSEHLWFNIDERSLCKLMAAESDLEFRKNHIMLAIRRARDARDFAKQCQFSVEVSYSEKQLQHLQRHPHFQKQQLKKMGYSSMSFMFYSQDNTTEIEDYSSDSDDQSDTP